MSGQATRAAMIGWTVLALLTCVHGGHMLDLLKAGGTPASPVGHHDLGPPPVPKVRCWCASYPNATICSWPEPSHSPPSHYIATCRERCSESVIKPCHLVQPGSSSSSERLWSCHLPNLRLLTDHIINVTAVYSNRSSSYLSSFMVEDILKPDPPVDVQVSLQAKVLQLRWSPPPTWANMDIFPLKYHIRYQWTARKVLKFVNLGPFESTTAHLRGLAPGRTYQFQVCAKELLGLGQCSHWSPAVEVTLPRSHP